MKKLLDLKDTEKLAYTQGKSAAYDATNPYPAETPEYEAWEKGWGDGDD